MSLGPFLAAAIADAIRFASYFAGVFLSTLLIVTIIGLFPFGARLAPLYRTLGLRDLEWMALMRLSIRDAESVAIPILDARFERCVELSVGQRRRRLRSIALFARAYVLLNEARWYEAATCLDESLSLAREAGRAADVANALRASAALRGMRGDLHAAQPLLDEAAGLLPDLRPRIAAALWLDIGWLASQQGNLPEARKGWSRCLDFASRGRSQHLIRMARLNLAWTDLQEGRDFEGRATLEALLAEAGPAGDLVVKASALATLAAADCRDGADELARSRAEAALAILEARGIALQAGEAHAVIGLVEGRSGNVLAAEERLALAGPLVITLAGRRHVAELCIALAEAAGREGRTADARDRYERAAAILAGIGEPGRAADVRRLREALLHA